MYVCPELIGRTFAQRSPELAGASLSRLVRRTLIFLSVGVKGVPVRSGQTVNGNFTDFKFGIMVEDPQGNCLQLFLRLSGQEVKIVRGRKITILKSSS